MPTIDKLTIAGADDCYTYMQDIYRIFITGAAIGAALMGTVYDNGCKFDDITIPGGSTISAAYLQFKSSQNWTYDTVNVTIKGEKNNAAAAFSSFANFDARVKTSASVAWNAIPTWLSGSWYSCVDISSIVQEIVDFYSGLSAANLAFLLYGNGGSDIRGYSLFYGGSLVNCPMLHIEYDEISPSSILGRLYQNSADERLYIGKNL